MIIIGRHRFVDSLLFLLPIYKATINNIVFRLTKNQSSINHHYLLLAISRLSLTINHHLAQSITIIKHQPRYSLLLQIDACLL